MSITKSLIHGKKKVNEKFHPVNLLQVAGHVCLKLISPSYSKYIELIIKYLYLATFLVLQQQKVIKSNCL